jgi:hypothetical protein
MSKSLALRLQMQEAPMDIIENALLSLEMARAVEAAQVEPEPADPPLMHLMS